MKKDFYNVFFNGKLIVLATLFFLLTGVSFGQWAVYDASVMPDENDPEFGTSGLSGAGMVSALVADPSNPDNMLLQLLTLENPDNGTWRHVYPEPVTGVTIIMRVKSADNNGRRVLELDLDNGGFRERFYINQEDNKLRLQHSAGFGVDNEFPLPGEASVKGWNIYRITKDAEGNVSLYVNEDPEPLAVGQTGQATSNNHFRFGDTNGSHNVSALVDWIIWDTSGVYAPGEGQDMPEGLDVSFDEPEESLVHNWRIYDGRNLPTDQFPVFDESNVAGDGASNTLVPDPEDEGNSFLELFTPTNSDNFMWRTPLQPETPGVTFVMKVKAANDEARRVIELDIHHNGIRERLYINREANRIRLNEGIGGGDGGEIEAPEGTDLGDWNIYRLTKSEGETKLYLNEDPEPLAFGITAVATTQQYYRFGDGNGSHNAAALIDWIIWDETGAYAPGEGSAIPANVVTPNWDATLAELDINGVPLAGFEASTTAYEIVLTEVPAEMPLIAAVANNPNAVLEITQVDEIPGSASVKVIAENGFTEIVYMVNFRYASTDTSLQDLLIDGETIEGFDPDVFDYEVELAQGTSDVPVITAVASDQYAEVEIIAATQIPGETKVIVTAEDGSTREYIIVFTVDATSALLTESLTFRLFPNPAGSAITLRWDGPETDARLTIISLSGQAVLQTRVSGNTLRLDIGHLIPGAYIMQLTTAISKVEQLFIKQ